MKEINMVSLFDGMHTLGQAFRDINVEVGKAYASEIKKPAIKLSSFHFPELIHLGDITKWRTWNIDWSQIDIITSGSPCKDLSIAGKRKGIYGANSGLFWIFIDILEHCKKLNPNVLFFQENVASANIKDIGIMSRALGVYPCRLNSSLDSAQLRDRYYWTNIVTEENMFGELITVAPKRIDKKIMFKDIIEGGAAYRDKKELGNNLVFVDRNKATAILESESRPLKNKVKLLKRYKKIGSQSLVFIQNNEVRVKTNPKKGYDVLTGNEPLYILQNFNIRILSKVELCRLQGFPDSYCDILTRKQAASLLGDGWNIATITYFAKQIKQKLNL